MYRATNVGVLDRRVVGGAPLRSATIEVVLEYRLDRAISPGADLQGAGSRALETIAAVGMDEPEDAATGAEALLRMRPVLQDELAEQFGGGSDAFGLAADPLNGPVGVTTMARRHMLGDRRVASAAGAHVSSDARALQEDLDSARRQADLDLLAGEAIRHGIEVPLDIDMVVDADASGAPLSEHVGFDRQRPEMGAVELLEQLPPRNPEPADRAYLVELVEHFANRLVQLGDNSFSSWA